MRGKYKNKQKTRQSPSDAASPPEPAQKEIRKNENESDIKASNQKPIKPRAWYKPESPLAVGAFTAGSVVAVIYLLQLLVMRGQLSVMQDTFAYANKPSVGINGIGVEHSGTDASGKQFTSKSKVAGTNNLHLTIEIKNFGPVPADDFTENLVAFVGGVDQVKGSNDELPATLFPGKVIYMPGRIGSTDYEAVMSGAKILELELTLRYRGPGKSYTYCEKHIYMPDLNAFHNLGSCPVKKPV